MIDLARVSNVELEVHPEISEEFEWLMGDLCFQAIANVKKCSYAVL